MFVFVCLVQNSVEKGRWEKLHLRENFAGWGVVSVCCSWLTTYSALIRETACACVLSSSVKSLPDQLCRSGSNVWNGQVSNKYKFV